MANGTADSALTLRKDSWWVAPLVTGWYWGLSESTPRGGLLQTNISLPSLTSRLFILRSYFLTGGRFPRPYLSSGRRLDSARPAITTEKHTIGHISSRLRAAGLNQSAKGVLTRGNRVSRSFCRTSTGFFSTRLLLSCSFCGLTRSRPFSSMTGSGSASEPYFLPQTRFCSACIRFPATLFATWWEGNLTCSQDVRPAFAFGAPQASITKYI